jgi:cyclopropane fatty-acyl-phospholipid synthase-like methyltransferase
MSDQNKTIYSEILEYWNDYYSSERRHLPQSLFAESVLQKEFLKPAYKLIDFGCGDGRDATFLAKKFKVIGLDISKKVIDINKKMFSKSKDVTFEVCSTELDLIQAIEFHKPDVFYARFLIHAITKDQETNLLKILQSYLPFQSYFVTEFRTIRDPLSAKGMKLSANERIHGHYRRFIDPNEFVADLSRANFEILDQSESEMYSPSKDDNPSLARIYAKKIDP